MPFKRLIWFIFAWLLSWKRAGDSPLFTKTCIQRPTVDHHHHHRASSVNSIRCVGIDNRPSKVSFVLNQRLCHGCESSQWYWLYDPFTNMHAFTKHNNVLFGFHMEAKLTKIAFFNLAYQVSGEYTHFLHFRPLKRIPQKWNEYL